MNSINNERMPVIYLPHGGGPWPWLPEQANHYSQLAKYLSELAHSLPQAPRAIVVVSAHWEEPKATVLATPSPPMLYDYSGFPPETYEIDWPAPGAPKLASDIQQMLTEARISSATNQQRGFDHGTFVPLALAYPEARIPTVQLSLVSGLDPTEHIQLGRAIAPLRDSGVLIIGSGMSYHNMRGFMLSQRGNLGPKADARKFDEWLNQAMTSSPDERERLLAHWEDAPAARACHPREEHLLPLHVCAGAALEDPGSLPFRSPVLGVDVSAVQFG